MTPDEVVKRAREENARQEKKETEKKQIFDRIFDKCRDAFRDILDDDGASEDELEEFDKDIEKKREDVWKEVKGKVSQYELEEVEKNIDDLMDLIFERIDEGNPANELFKKIKEIREQDEYMKERAARRRA